MVNTLPFPLLSEENYNAEMDQVLLRLEQLRQSSGICARVENMGIYWEYYAPDQGSDEVIFLSHGFTESTLEYSELISYFLKAGYGVFICDHMGHGKSYRLVRETWLTHITSFADYIKDMHYLIEQVLLPMSKGKRRYLYGHSMGGAIAVLYLEQHPGVFEKAVLSSPMVSPSAGSMPDFLGGALASFMCMLGQGERPIMIQKPFDGEDHWEDNNCTTSKARYLWYLERQKQDINLQNSAATYSWAKEAANVQYPILAQAYSVQIPVLLCQAGQDTVVNLPPQDDLIHLLPKGRKIVYHEAKHEIYRSSNDTLERFLTDIFDLFCYRTLAMAEAVAPSGPVAVMVAVPLPTAETTPFSLTVATAVLEEVHVT